jgi:hypothetical protein
VLELVLEAFGFLVLFRPIVPRHSRRGVLGTWRFFSLPRRVTDSRRNRVNPRVPQRTSNVLDGKEAGLLPENAADAASAGPFSFRELARVAHRHL